MLSKDKIALIYFSRSAEQEAESKKWAAKSTKGQRLAISKFLTTQAASSLHSSGLEVLCFDETRQTGMSFGEKLANSFESAFNQGFTAAIAVGNDCLDLQKVDFSRVAEHLRMDDAVVGPTYRQGAYLIGMTQSHFDKKAFESLRWQSSQLEEDLLRYFSGQCIPIEVLVTLRDANTLIDFKKILQSLSTTATLLKRLRNFVAYVSAGIKATEALSISQISLRFEPLRGPPSVFY